MLKSRRKTLTVVAVVLSLLWPVMAVHAKPISLECIVEPDMTIEIHRAQIATKLTTRVIVHVRMESRAGQNHLHARDHRRRPPGFLEVVCALE